MAAKVEKVGAVGGIDKKNNDGNSPLHCASKGGSAESVQILLDVGASIDLTNIDGDTPLHIATRERHGDIVKILLEAGASQSTENKSGETPWHIAAASSQAAILALFKESSQSAVRKNSTGINKKHFVPTEEKSFGKSYQKDNIDKELTETRKSNQGKISSERNELIDDGLLSEKLLYDSAISSGTRSELSKSKQFKGKPNKGHSKIHKGCEMPDSEKIDTYYSTSNFHEAQDDFFFVILNNNHIIIPSFFNHLEAAMNFSRNCPFNLRQPSVREQLEHEYRERLNRLSRTHVDVDARLDQGMTLLMVAARFGAEEAVKKFIKKSDVNAICLEGRSSFLTAAASGSVKILKMLFKAKANIYHTCKGLSALHVAAGMNHLSAVKYLLSIGLDPNKRSEIEGYTALHLAVINRNLEMVVTLLDGGADKNISDKNGLKPIYFAELDVELEIVDLLSN